MQAPATALALLNAQLAIVARENANMVEQQDIIVAQQVIIDDPLSSEQEIEDAEDEQAVAQYWLLAATQIRDAAQLLIDGTNNNGLQALSDGTNPEIVAGLHGDGADITVTKDTKFVTVQLQPNGCIKLFFSPVFTNHFFLLLTSYGTRLLGLGQDGVVAFRYVAAIETIAQGYTALTNNNPAITIVGGGTDETVEYPATHPLERYFDHRIRLEIEAQIGIPPTVVWSTDERQKISHVIATFPISMTSQSSVVCNSEGAATAEVHFQSDMLVGDITWRRAEDKITERYLVQNSQYFHNVRLELFMVRKHWVQDEFRFIRETMSFSDGESWTGKLRFRSIK